MTYAIVQNGIVTNMIELANENAAEFPEAVPVGDVSAGIGDAFADSVFSRDGVALLTPMQAAEDTITELAEQVIDLQIALAEAGVTA